jgi:purine-cytosine permease-like protein
MSWVKWYRSKTAWVIIIAAVVAMVGAFLCAYYLPFPYNLIGAIACCVPSGIIIRKVAIKALTKKGEEKE